MPSKQIATPFGYGGAADDGGGFDYFEAQAGGTITALQVVRFQTGNANGIVIAAAGAVSEICGIALDSAVVGGIVRVVKSGFLPGVTVDAGAGVTAGDLVTSAASGNLVTAVSAATLIGTFVGVVTETTAASGLAPLLVKLV